MMNLIFLFTWYVVFLDNSEQISYWWLSARLQYLQSISSGDNQVFVCPSVCLSVCPSKWCYRSNSLKISGISLKFGGVIHSNMKQIAFLSGHTGPIFACSVELWNFQNRLGPGWGTMLPL